MLIVSVEGDSGAEMWLKAELRLMSSHKGEQQIGLQSHNLISTIFISYP